MGSAFTKLFTTIKAGIGIDIGGRIVGALQAIPARIAALAQEAARMAAEVKDAGERLNMTTDAVQVLGFTAKNAGADMGILSRGLIEIDRSIAEGRSGFGATVNAFRALGLEARVLEQMAPERRFEAVAKAIVNAKDQTAAFNAGSVILGSKTLPLLHQTLREVAAGGYDELAKKMKDAGLVMDNETIERLDRAVKTLERLKLQAVITAGETAGAFEQIATAARKDLGGTFLAPLKAYFNGDYSGLRQFSLDYAAAQPKNTPKPQAPVIQEDTAAINQLRTAELNLLNTRSIRAQVEADKTISETERRRQTLALLKEERDLLTEIHQLKSQGFVTIGDNSPDQVALRTLRPIEQGAPVTPEQLKIQAEANKRGNDIDKIQGEITELSGARGIPRFNRALVEMRDNADSTFTLLSAGMSGMTEGISAALGAARNLGDGFKAVFRSIGGSIAAALQQLVAMRIAMSIFGFMGFSGAAAAEAAPTVAAAGGGTFVTSGPTNLTVGDNPGGAELVSVIPLSGRGVTRVNGRGIAMAGGGVALAGGGARSGLVVHQTIQISTGVSDTVRAELMQMMPTMRSMAVDGVQDAISRGELRV